MKIFARLPDNLSFNFVCALGILITLSFFLCSLGTVSPVKADGDGWYLDGAPVIQKNTPNADTCTSFGMKLSIGDGSASGSKSWKDCSGGSKCGGTYTGTVTWTQPPSFMQPGSKINFTMSEKTTAQNTCGEYGIDSWGSLKVDGAIIVQVLDRLGPTATGAYTVKAGSPGAKLTVLVSMEAADQIGTVTYNYTYKGAGAAASTPTQAPTVSPKAFDAPGPLVDKLPAPPGVEPVGFVQEFKGTVYVSAGPTDLPPSQQKWILVKGRTALYEGWNVRTAPDSEAFLLHYTGALTRTGPSSWFEMQLLRTKQTEQSVVYGRLIKGIANFYMEKYKESTKKFEVETDRADCAIKGTNFIVEATDIQTLLKVIEGTVDFTSKKDGQSATIEAGQMIAATDSGLGQKSTFDVASEKAKWGPMPPPDITNTTTSTSTTQSDSSGSTSTTKKPGFALPKCPITTAMGGDPIAPGLAIFRSFRDRVLAKSEPGRGLIALYYGTGTWVTDNLLGYPVMQDIARDLVIKPASLALNASSFAWNN